MILWVSLCQEIVVKFDSPFYALCLSEALQLLPFKGILPIVKPISFWYFLVPNVDFCQSSLQVGILKP